MQIKVINRKTGLAALVAAINEQDDRRNVLFSLSSPKPEIRDDDQDTCDIPSQDTPNPANPLLSLNVDVLLHVLKYLPVAYLCLFSTASKKTYALINSSRLFNSFSVDEFFGDDLKHIRHAKLTKLNAIQRAAFLFFKFNITGISDGRQHTFSNIITLNEAETTKKLTSVIGHSSHYAYDCERGRREPRRRIGKTSLIFRFFNQPPSNTSEQIAPIGHLANPLTSDYYLEDNTRTPPYHPYAIVPYQGPQ